jgi:hypothetical protein
VNADEVLTWGFIVFFLGGFSWAADVWYVKVTRPWRKRRKRLARERRENRDLELKRAQAALDAVKPAQAICQCEHGLAFHDRATGHCNGPLHGGAECGCRQYIGPEPLPAFYAPELVDVDGGDAL